jgi:hypothetical protein
MRAWLVLAGVSNSYMMLLVLGVVASKSDLLVVPRFSLRRFYLLMGWVPLSFGALAILSDVRYLAFFLAAGVAGVLGELLVSVLWRRFFDEPIWTYSYRSVLGGYTSTLNFLPWAFGALLFQLTGRLAGMTPAPGELAGPMWVSAIAFTVGLVIAWVGRVLGSRRRAFTGAGLALFCFPIALTALALGVLHGPGYPLVMAAFAIVGFASEYAYGRGMSLFFERGLWTYNHWKIDEGHSSFITFPLWALGGLYFHFLAALLGL